MGASHYLVDVPAINDPERGNYEIEFDNLASTNNWSFTMTMTHISQEIHYILFDTHDGGVTDESLKQLFPFFFPHKQ